MKLLLSRLPIYLCLGVAAFGYGYAADLEIPVALIEILSGHVSLREPGQDASVVLNTQKDKGRLLYPGEIITCGPGAAVTIRVDRMLTGGNGPDSCNPSSREIHVPPLTKNQSQRGEGVLANLKDYVLAGRDKGSDSAIFSPAHISAITVDRFSVRWRTVPPLGQFNAILRDSNGVELARVGDVDEPTGRLDSEGLRVALSNYALNDRPNHEVHLVFQSVSGQEQSVSFVVLTKEQEMKLNKALDGENAQRGLFAHLARAAIFDSFRMYNSVAAEYDAALNEAPDSLTLLRAALSANSRVGDLRRARALRDKLQEAEQENRH